MFDTMNLISELKLEGYVVKRHNMHRNNYSDEAKKFIPTSSWHVYSKGKEDDPEKQIMIINKYGFFKKPEILLFAEMATEREKKRINEISKPYVERIRTNEQDFVD